MLFVSKLDHGDDIGATLERVSTISDLRDEGSPHLVALDDDIAESRIASTETLALTMPLALPACTLEQFMDA